MKIADILKRIRSSLVEIQPGIDLIDFEGGIKPLVVICVVSERFDKMPTYARTFWVDSMIERNDSALHKTIELAYECATLDEYAVGLRRKYELH